MERKIGETFEFEGKKIEVRAASRACDGCFLEEKCCIDSAELLGTCGFGDRTDKKDVIFVEIQEQPQQAEQPQKLNLCEILKNCPKGEKFWSPMLGAVKLHDIIQSEDIIIIEAKNRETWEINSDGTINIGDIISPEIMLYPSKEQRDWTKIKYEKKTEKFDPKTLKPFDRVLARNHGSHRWTCDLFSDIIDGNECMYHCIDSYYRYCIPYNDETKHLVDTKEEAPDFYKYWED